jgi:biotin transport system ATP-binding protein
VTTTGAHIQVEGLTHRFPGGGLGLEAVDLEASPGEMVVIAGRNGSGKTTLLKHLNGLLAPTAGTVRIDGRSVARDPGRARRRVGLVFQDTDTQIVGETVRADVAFGPENLGLDRREVDRRVTDVLRRLSLERLADAPPHLLSGGERRRLAIAGVLAMAPGAVCLDEPFSNLDLPGVREVLTSLFALRSEGHTLVVVTHEIEKMLPHARRIVLMDGGRVVADGPAGAVLPLVERHGVRLPDGCRLEGGPRSWLD